MQYSRFQAVAASSSAPSSLKLVGSAVHTPLSISFAASFASFLRYFMAFPVYGLRSALIHCYAGTGRMQLAVAPVPPRHGLRRIDSSALADRMPIQKHACRQE